MTEDDGKPGLDRRSLIKKGLVAGGIAASAPVIMTFNSAAFASSVPGCHEKQYTVSAAANAVVAQEAPTTSGGCDPTFAGCTWVGQAQDNVTPVTVTPAAPSGSVITFTLPGSYASCEFVAATAVNAAGTCNTAAFTGVGTNTVVFTRPTGAWTVRLLINC